MKIKTLIAFAAIFAVIVGCSPKTDKMPVGLWRAVLTTESGAEIPFNFELKNSNNKYSLNIINGDNIFAVDSVTVNNDSVHIVMPLFGGEFKLKADNGKLTGNFIKSSYSMPFTAKHGQSYRFLKKETKPAFDVSGKWQITFDNNETAVAEWKQQGSKVTGSVMTPSGDYRFLEGNVTSKGDFYVSGFDGGFIILLTGKLTDAKTLINGKLYSGYKSMKNFTAVADENAALSDAYQVTTMREGDTKLVFTFLDLNEKPVSLADDKFKNKVVIVQFSGSWCPNCLDETMFLSDFYDKNKNNVEVICLAFERYTEFDKAKAEALKLVKRCNVNYDVLITGIQPKPQEIMEVMPMLVNFKMFPTTIIIDKKGNVNQIHAGFSGPGTGKNYTEFVTRFTETVNKLVQE